MSFRKKQTITIVLLAIFVMAVFAFQKNGGNRAAAADYSGVNGFAWSDNIGWIQMGGYTGSVKIDLATGDMSGFAWTDTVGWINFGPAKDLVAYPGCGYPSLPCNSAKLDLATGQVSGWARVESIKTCSGGWSGCGWILMQSGASFGVKYDLDTNNIDGTNKWAWSDDFGWLDFSQTSLGNLVVIPTDTDYSYTDQYEYPKGIIVNTYVDTQGGTYSGNASITKGESVYYTLEVSNQSSIPKTIDLKFNMPAGYIFAGVVSCSTGVTPCANPTGTNIKVWSGITVPAGMSTVKFKLNT